MIICTPPQYDYRGLSISRYTIILIYCPSLSHRPVVGLEHYIRLFQGNCFLPTEWILSCDTYIPNCTLHLLGITQIIIGMCSDHSSLRAKDLVAKQHSNDKKLKQCHGFQINACDRCFKFTPHFSPYQINCSDDCLSLSLWVIAQPSTPTISCWHCGQCHTPYRLLAWRYF